MSINPVERAGPRNALPRLESPSGVCTEGRQRRAALSFAAISLRGAITPAVAVLTLPALILRHVAVVPWGSQLDALRLPPAVSCASLRHAAVRGMAAARFGQPTGCTRLP